MNIAIIIGVSTYTESNDNLPGCKNDAHYMKIIIEKTNKFDNILYINENELSAKTKELITNFITDYKGKPIDEFFFYYSGHGLFSNDEFYYVLSDFDPKRRNQTSIQNTEIDDLIRTLSPNLVIKVIDACQSGTTYIKENNFINKYFDESKKGFKKCYFLNSSLNNQSSYQNDHISSFTNSFISALKEHKSDGIRYKDIIDVISDEFQDNNDQTPFFIIQADLTEKFCSFSSDLRSSLNGIDGQKSSTLEEKESSLTIFELVKNNAKEYVDKLGAKEAIVKIKRKIDTTKINSALDEFYTLSVNYLEELDEVPQKNVIENWLKKNNSNKEYFATPIYRTVYDPYGDEYVELKSFDLGIDIPYKAISIDYFGKLPNLIDYHCTVLHIISKRFIRFFYFITNYTENSWENKFVNAKDIQWITAECKIKDDDEISERIDIIFKSIENKIMDELHERFGLANSIPTDSANSTEE